METVLLVLLITSPYWWSVVAIVCHELAHAITAKIVRGKIHSVQLGAGPDLVSFKLFSITWIIRPYPWLGLVRGSLLPGRFIRWRNIAFLAAGPGANIAIATACGFAAQSLVTSTAPLDSLLRSIWTVGFLTNAFFVVVTVLPRQVSIHSGTVPRSWTSQIRAGR